MCWRRLYRVLDSCIVNTVTTFISMKVHEIIVKIFVLRMKRVQDNTLEYCILLYN